MKTSIPNEEVFAALPAARRERIKERAAVLIAEEYALRDLRKAKQVTQEEVAERLGSRQVYVSRLERRADIKLSTLRAYLKAIGGDLQLMVTFPDGRPVKLCDIGVPAGRKRSTTKPPQRSVAVRKRA